VEIKRNDAAAREAEATGESAFTRLTGQAEADRVEALGLAEAKAVEALGLARARGFEEQKEALGQGATAFVNAIAAIAEGRVDIMPEVLVTGGGSLDGLAATLMRQMGAGATNGSAPASS
jgi:uncharacterized membrane protein YqiK